MTILTIYYDGPHNPILIVKAPVFLFLLMQMGLKNSTGEDAHVDGTFQGAFTWALIKALKSDGFRESYSKLLIQIKTYLEGGGFKQVPALSTTHKMYLDCGFLGEEV